VSQHQNDLLCMMVLATSKLSHYAFWFSCINTIYHTNAIL